jgi:cyclic pyranopterin phosphate synthase
MQVIKDKYGRTFRTLRVSLLNHCNLGCIYCVAPEAGDGQETGLPASALREAPTGGQPLTVSALLGIISRLHGQLGLETIRLTGGEPLLYHGLVELVRGIRATGIPEIKLTTNGFLLERLARPLKEAGIGSVNISLDAVDEAVFFQMSRRHSVERIVRGIDAACEAGLDIKINTVLMKGINDSQVIPLLELAAARKIPIRFLEIMAMGHLHDQSARYLLSRDEILGVIGQRYRFVSMGRAPSATAHYWKTEEGHVFGIIANESEPFCGDCNRIRLDSSGNIYGCLSSNHPIPLDNMDSEEEWAVKLRQALEQKQSLRFTGSELSMLHIGG